MPIVTKLTTLDCSKEEPLTGRGPVPHPIGQLVSEIRSHPLLADPAARARIGIWESTPGQWRRQQQAAELSVIVSGRCSFVPDDEAEIEMTAGDVVYFPEDTQGLWVISETVRKIYVLL